MEITKIHAIELDTDGRFVCDAPDFDPEAPTLENWTADRCPDGLYQARYTGTRNDTGEWVDGEWVDDAAPDLLAQAKAEARNRVNLWRDEQEQGGFDHDGHRWDSDTSARGRIASVAPLCLVGIDPPTGYWTDADNIDVPMTAANFVALYTAMLTAGGAVHDRQRAMKTEVDALADVAAVESYVVGWSNG